MNTPKPLFTLTAEGNTYEVQPAGVLLILADMVYGPQDDPAWTGRVKTEAMVQAMLAAARAGRDAFGISAGLRRKATASGRGPRGGCAARRERGHRRARREARRRGACEIGRAHV